jgi:hypothetical protein
MIVFLKESFKSQRKASILILEERQLAINQNKLILL